MIVLIAVLISFYLTVVLIPPLCKIANRLSLVDLPNERKIHKTQIPRVGGIGIITGSLFTFCMWVWLTHLPLTKQFKAYLLGVLILFVTGILDDFFNLDYKKKFFGQCLAAGVTLLLGQLFITNLGVWTTSAEIILPFWMTVFLTFFFIVGVTNAFNLSDGLDGLAGGISIFIFLTLAIISFLDKRADLLIACLVIIGALLAFLRYNSFPALVFMGDTGSLFLGFTAAFISIGLTQSPRTALARTLPLLILALPIMDTLSVMVGRRLKGESLFKPDQKHFHYQFMKIGFSHPYAVLWIYLLQAIMCFLSIKLRYFTDSLIFTIFMAIFASVLLFFFFARRSNKNLSGGEKMISGVGNYINKPTIIYLKAFSFNYIKLSLSLGLIWLSATSPIDEVLGIYVVIIFGVISLILLGTKNLLYKYCFRYTIYVLVAVLLLISQRASVFQLPFSLQTFHHVFWGSIAGAVLLYHIVTRFSTLNDTPLDYIILLTVLILPFLPVEIIGRWYLGTVTGGMLVFFWSSDILIKNQEKDINLFSVSCFVTIIILSLRLIYNTL